MRLEDTNKIRSVSYPDDDDDEKCSGSKLDPRRSKNERMIDCATHVARPQARAHYFS